MTTVVPFSGSCHGRVEDGVPPGSGQSLAGPGNRSERRFESGKGLPALFPGPFSLGARRVKERQESLVSDGSKRSSPRKLARDAATVSSVRASAWPMRRPLFSRFTVTTLSIITCDFVSRPFSAVGWIEIRSRGASRKSLVTGRTVTKSGWERHHPE